MTFFSRISKFSFFVSCVLSLMLIGSSTICAQKRVTTKPNVTKNKDTKPQDALLQLQESISALLGQKDLAGAGISIRVISQSSGKVIFEKDSEKLLKPASNMKLYTTALALESLGSDYRIKTSVYSKSKPDQDGNIKGDIILYGRGDPTLASTYRDELKPFELLSKQLVDAGVKNIEGNLIADESYFRGSPLGQGWEWLDIQWPFGAEISALTSYDNKFDLEIKPGAKVGDSCQLLVTPDIGEVELINKLNTSELRSSRQIGLNRGLADNSLLAWGSLPINDLGFSTKIAFHQPAKLTAKLFEQSLKKVGITVKGKIIVVDASLRSPLPPSEPDKLVELAFLESPPLSEMIRVVNKFSQNLYAELLLRLVGKIKGKPEKDSDEAGVEVLKEFLRQAKISPDNLAIYDGSGLSRKDLINVLSTTELLRYMSNSPRFEDFRGSLPVAGLDGTLRRRMNNTPAQENVKAKTGTLSNTTSLSGYVTSTQGEAFIFSIMVDNLTSEFKQGLIFQDKICEYLAGFTGKIDGSLK